MKVFKISTKFEQNGEWSERKADVEGYLIQPNDEDDIVEGYVKMMYPTHSEQVRYIKGLYSNDSLIYMQLCNNSSMSPVCYCFPNINEKNGFWSAFNYRYSFFPVYPDMACSQGHATLIFEEITDSSIEKIAQETSKIFTEKSGEAISMNSDLMSDVKSLTDFLDDSIIFQMKLHCGKW